MKLAIDYHDRIKHFNDNTLLKKSYLEQKNLNLEWYANVSAIVDKFGSGERKRTSINVNENLNSEFKMHWNNNKTVSEKLAFYDTIKLEFKRENYLRIVNYYHRAALARLRISAHDLKIERGRYTVPKTPRIERTCDYCKIILQNIEIENEHHALYSCPLYIKPRDKLYKNIKHDPLDILRTSDNIIELSRIGKLAYEMFSLHKSFLAYIKTDDEDT